MGKILFLLCGLISFKIAAKTASPSKAPISSKENASAKESKAKKEEIQDCSKLPQSQKVELWNKANCFFKKKERIAAVDVLRHLYTEFPDDLDAFFLSSYLLWEEGLANVPPKREEYYKRSLEELNKVSAQNPEHWRVFTELGDHFFFREQKPEKAQSYYLSARKFYAGNPKKGIPEAADGQKSSIEDRIARNSEALDRRGDAVTATCLSLYYDPDDEEAQGRLNRLGGACKRKNFRPKKEGEANTASAEHPKEEHP